MRFNTLLGTCTLTQDTLILKEGDIESRVKYSDIDTVHVQNQKLGAQPVLVIEKNGESLSIPVRTRKLGEKAVDIIRRHKANKIKL